MIKLLALAPQHRLTREKLIDASWPDLRPRAGAANLRKAAHHALRCIGADHGVVQAYLAVLRGGQLWGRVLELEPADETPIARSCENMPRPGTGPRPSGSSIACAPLREELGVSPDARTLAL